MYVTSTQGAHHKWLPNLQVHMLYFFPRAMNMSSMISMWSMNSTLNTITTAHVIKSN